MDGFTGFNTAANEEVPRATTVMCPFHVVRLAGESRDECRRRVQQAIHRHRSRKGDPIYSVRRTLHTGLDLLTDKQRDRLRALSAEGRSRRDRSDLGHIHQRIIAAYRHKDRRRGRELMANLIASITSDVPKALVEIIKLGHTLNKRVEDVTGPLRSVRHQQRPDRGDQRQARTPARLRPRVLQPHQPHRQIAARDRRLQTATTPSIVKSRQNPTVDHAQTRRPPREAAIPPGQRFR